MQTPGSSHLLLLALFLLIALIALSPKAPVTFDPSKPSVAEVKVKQNY